MEDTTLTRAVWQLYMGDVPSGAIESGDLLKLAVREAWVTALERRPHLTGYRTQFVEALSCVADSGPDAHAIIRKLRVEDLLLVRAALAGDRESQAEIGRLAETHVLPWLTTVLRDRERAAESVQRTVVDALYPSADKSPTLNSYRGYGRLTAWLQTSARHNAFGPGRVGDGSPYPELPGLDPEEERIRAEIKKPATDALTRTLEKLPEKERRVLTLYLVKGLSLDEIGRLFGVHRATAHRWIQNAQRNLRRTYIGECETFGITRDGVDCMFALFDCELSLSLNRLLSAGVDDEENGKS